MLHVELNILWNIVQTILLPNAYVVTFVRPPLIMMQFYLTNTGSLSYVK